MMGRDARPSYEWHVVTVNKDELEETLNALERSWEVFAVTPTIKFGSKFMGGPVPSEVLHTVIVRRQKG